MILNTVIEEVVNEIKSGKRDLYETIEHYMKLIDSYSDKEKERIDELIIYYEEQMESLEDELENNAELYDAQKDYIEKLDAKIEDLEYEIRQSNKIIRELEEHIVRLRYVIENQEKEIDKLEQEKLKYHIQEAEGIIV